MKSKIEKVLIYNFCRRLLEEASVSDEEISEAELESLMWEAGTRYWEDYDDYFIVEYDYE